MERGETSSLDTSEKGERRPFPWLWCIEGRSVWRLRLERGRKEEAQP